MIVEPNSQPDASRRRAEWRRVATCGLALMTQVLAVACTSGATLAVNPGLKDDRAADRLHAALARGSAQSGLASWYGGKFHGRRTANGEVYDMNGISAAHKTLPFGTVVRVNNLDNGRSIKVRINDRGPFIRGRILDLSRGAAQQLGLIGPGVARIELTVDSWPSTGPTTGRANGRSSTPSSQSTDLTERGETWVQAGAFRDRSRARALAARLQDHSAHFRVYSSGGWHRVQARLDNSDAAADLLARLQAAGVEVVLRRP